MSLLRVTALLPQALAVFIAGGVPAVASAPPHPGAEAFAIRTAERLDLPLDTVRQVLAEARYQQSVIDAIVKPAESKPWYQYRALFITERRIAGGRLFLAGHRDMLAGIERQYAVPASIVTAIAGVETTYGTNTGRYRVIDALATLGFYYPKRGAFFSDELAEFIKLSSEEGLPWSELRGSYAGAMGLGQFMPSSYRAYAVDFDGDGRRDLWSSAADALASIANYLHRHHWRDGERIAVPAALSDNAQPPAEPPVKLSYTLGELAALGIRPLYGEYPADTPAMLVPLDAGQTTDYWLGFHNFHVLTRYNRSPLYGMAVFQLSEILNAAGSESTP